MRRWIPRSGSYSRAQDPEPKASAWIDFLRRILHESRDELAVLAAGTIAALVRASGVQIQTGHAGLLFHFGRATKVLEHGFRPLIPYFQQVRVVPIRSRTMDLPSQRIVNRDGLVYQADANLVYHVHDVRKAVIEINDLEQGMLQMLTLGVQEVLRETTHSSIRDTDRLARALEANLSARLTDWGVTVDKAGFPTLTPSHRTLRITQLEQKVTERFERYQGFRASGHRAALALGLVGTRHFPRPRSERAQRSEFARRVALKALRKVLIRKVRKRFPFSS